MDATPGSVGRRSRARWAFVGFAVLAAAALAFEHRLHVVPYLPWLLVVACPLMHLFHRHGGHGDRHNAEEKP